MKVALRAVVATVLPLALIGIAPASSAAAADATVAVSIGDAVVREGVRPSSWRQMLLPLTLTHPAATDVVVTYRTADGTATAPSDYEGVTAGIVRNSIDDARWVSDGSAYVFVSD